MPRVATILRTHATITTLYLFAQLFVLPVPARADALVSTAKGMPAKIGGGYDSLEAQTTLAMCLDPDSYTTSSQEGLPAPNPGQIAPAVTVKEVSGREEGMREMHLSTEISVSFLFGSADASAAWNQSTKFSESHTTLVVHEEILNSPNVMLPKSRGWGKLTGLLQGKADQIPAAIEFRNTVFKSAPLGRDYRALETLTGEKVLSNTRLKQEYADMLKADPDQFQTICGDSYVFATYTGGSLNATLSLNSTSQQENTEFSSSLSGSYSAVADFSVNFKQAVSHLSSTNSLDLNISRVGGASVPVPTTIDALLTNIEKLPGQVHDAPVATMFVVRRYVDLNNTYTPPSDRLHRLTVAYNRYETIYRTLLDEKEHPAYYAISGGLNRDMDVNSKGHVLDKKIDDAQAVLVQITEEIKRCRKNIKECQKVEKVAEFDDWHALTALATPSHAVKDSVKQDYLTASEFIHSGHNDHMHCPPCQRIVMDYPQRVAEARFDQWLRRAKDGRCTVAVDADCITEERLEKIRAQMLSDIDTPVYLLAQRSVHHGRMSKSVTKASKGRRAKER